MICLRIIGVLGLMLSNAAVAQATLPNDAYIAGYATSMLRYKLNLDIPTLIVQNGVIILPQDSLNIPDQSHVVQMLSEIAGVNEVRIEKAITKVPIATAPSQPIQQSADQTVAITKTDPTLFPTGLLPSGHLFKPLLADPRWAHFSASYRHFLNDNFEGRNIGAVSFGETIPFYRGNFGRSLVQWEAGLQAAVFSDFNLGASSSDLINTDFIASAYSSVRAKQFSAFGRIYHQSSHLGDEFLLSKVNSTFERINLSYEGADLRLSYEFPYGIRLYGGGGGLFHKEPSSLKVWMTQYGIEFRSPWRMEFAPIRPVVAVDFKNFQENNWGTDVSARAGVQFDNLQVLGRNLQILLEYFNGNSPSGQFLKNNVEYIGVGAHYHF
ncbi:DUF1207 domain-containing protein [Nitrosomonas supralitoralis]|uniref:DUF1207 domain-containing protein n=1 Tax=Nitrosomonas supralitoralis TaxID=2116706 RepID=A0A2P7NY97_9PROT|nr:DUF1207 domain-containing protein [Nitrosomonas supralitoralis]PSJ18434.1 DUF1207 domain-containing protein [Nitrosomonas supralitoralis]